MEDRKLPWWRRALNIALGGIRSGFGLFSKPQKEGLADESETAAAHEEAPARIAESIAPLAAAEPLVEAVIAEEPLHLPEPVAEVVAKPVAEAAVAAAAETVSEPVPDVIAESVAEPFHEIDLAEAASEESVVEHEALEGDLSPVGDSSELTEDLAVVEVEDASAHVPDPERVPEAVALEPETAGGDEVEAISIEELPEEVAPEAAIDTETEAEVVADDENEIPVTVEAEGAVFAGVEAEAETAMEEEASIAASECEESAEEISAETVEPPAELDEPATAPEPEVEAVPEPALEEELVPIEDSISAEAVSSVELSEPVLAEVAAETAGQPDAVGDESEEEELTAPEPVFQSEEPVDQVAEAAAERAAELAVEPVAEPDVEATPEHDTEQVAEETPEPVDIPMELNDPIPAQPTEPTEANESVPVEEAVTAAEAVPSQETAEQTVASEMKAAEALAEVADEAGPTAAATPAAPSKPFIKLESRDNESDLSPFSVVVSQVYDGPLDLLLDLIRKQDIDIYDIPIARITAQFLAYVNQLKATDVDVAGEFIYTASLLIHIKSKMLLPRAPSGGDDAAEDPRRELVERLLEHERFKNAAQMLQQKQMLEAATWTNPGIREFQDDTSAEPEIAADTVDLVRIFRDILERARNRPVINVEEDSVTVGQMIQFLARRLTMEDKPVALRRLLSQTRSERALIAMFLALLELVRLQAILLRQDRLFSEIFIKKHTGFESVMNEGAASVHDDWR